MTVAVDRTEGDTVVLGGRVTVGMEGETDALCDTLGVLDAATVREACGEADNDCTAVAVGGTTVTRRMLLFA